MTLAGMAYYVIAIAGLALRNPAPLLVLAMAIPAILAFGVTALSDHGLAGLAQRLYFLALFGWMAMTALRIITAPPAGARE